MFNGGTNFGYSGFSSLTTYDYGAQIGEAGQLRQDYFLTRAPQAFTQTFQSLIATSKDGASLVSNVTNGVSTYVRKSPSNGIAVFLDNKGTSPIQTQVTLNNPSVTFPAGNTRITVIHDEVRPVVVAAPWTANATFQYLATNVLGKLTLGSMTYYVLLWPLWRIGRNCHPVQDCTSDYAGKPLDLGCIERRACNLHLSNRQYIYRATFELRRWVFCRLSRHE